MNEKCYLVLSVREINRMLKVARKQAHARGLRGRDISKDCLVLSGIEVSFERHLSSEDGEGQIDSCSIDMAVRNIEKGL